MIDYKNIEIGTTLYYAKQTTHNIEISEVVYVEDYSNFKCRYLFRDVKKENYFELTFPLSTHKLFYTIEDAYKSKLEEVERNIRIQERNLKNARDRLDSLQKYGGGLHG